MNSKKDKHVIIVLDSSGSMSGSPIKTCKSTLEKLFKFLHSEVGNNKIDLVTFQNSVYDIKTFGLDLKKCLSEI